MKLLRTALLLVTLSAASAGAASPDSAFPYQGRLFTNGVAATGLFDFQFRLAESGNTAVVAAWTNQIAGLGVTNGLFNARVDFGPGVFDGTERWLQVGVREAGSTGAFEPLGERRAILPVPYAHFADNARNLSGAAGAAVTNAQTDIAKLAADLLTSSNGLSGRLLATNTVLVNALLAEGLLRTNAQDALNADLLNVTNGLSARLNTFGGLVVGALARQLSDLLTGNQIYSGSNLHSGVIVATNATNLLVGSFTGDGAGLTNLSVPVANLVGTLAAGQIPGLDASKITSGTFADSLLAQLSTPGKVANAATTATSANTPNAIVARDGSGNFAAGIITAGSYLGTGSPLVVGTTDSQPLDLHVNGLRALRLEPAVDLEGNARPNVIGGATNNSIDTHGSFIGGGHNNTIQTNSYLSTIGGGSQNTIYFDSRVSTIAGGLQNTIYPDSRVSTIGGGLENTIEPYSIGSTIGGGRENTVSGEGAAVVGGVGALADKFGQQAHASGYFDARGDAQGSQYILRAENAADFQGDRVLLLDGAFQEMVLPNSSTWTFEVLITGMTRAEDSAGFKITGVIKRKSDRTTTLVGTPVVTSLGTEGGLDGVTASAAANAASGALEVKLNVPFPIPEARWVATVRTAEVRFSGLILLPN